MRAPLFATLLLIGPCLANAENLEIELSPPGTGPGVGLHPLNEIIPGLSNGSGNEVGSGIFFDSLTRILSLNLAYGSAFGFTDLTSPAFSWLLHGPAPLDETAPVIFDLRPLHTFAVDHAQGGHIDGTLTLNATQEADLLAGLYYINIYTPENIGGELRGQLVVVPEPNAMTLFLGLGASVLLWRFVGSRRQNFR